MESSLKKRRLKKRNPITIEIVEEITRNPITESAQITDDQIIKITIKILRIEILRIEILRIKNLPTRSQIINLPTRSQIINLSKISQ